ncbi:MAG: flippase [Candidatus Electrothrix sp. AR3]|nr:flippase [Candidatus Electrothrix sp. AR3]
MKSIKKNALRAQLIRGFIGNAGLKLINIPLILFTGVLLARLLGPEQYGIYTFVLSIVALLNLPTQGGLPTLIMRETAKYQQAGDWERLQGVFKSANGFAVGISLSIAFVAATIIMQLHHQNSKIFLWAFLLLPISALSQVRQALLQGFRKVVQGSIPEQLVRPLVIIVLLGLSAVSGQQLLACRAVQYSIAGSFAAFFVGTFLLHKNMPASVLLAKSTYEFRTWSKSLAILVLVSGLGIVNNQITTVLLGILAAPSDVGLFRVASHGATILSLGLTVVNAVIAPHIVLFYQSRDYVQLQRMLTASVRVIFILALLIFMIYLFQGKMIITLLFGDEYLSSYSALIILSLGQLASVAFGSVALILNMIGKEKKIVKTIVVSIIINIVLCVALIPNMGSKGAAIATALSIFSWNFLLSIKIFQLTGLNSTVLSLKRNVFK